jgi:hypothetical protein
MSLGVFAAKGVLSLKFKLAYSMGDLIVQHLDELEQEAQDKAAVQQALNARFAKIYKVAAPRWLATATRPAA